MSNRALILGVTGQDGAYLASLLLVKGYEVYGTTRACTNVAFSNLEKLNISDNVLLRELDPSSYPDVYNVISETDPTEVYNLTGPSSVSESFIDPFNSLNLIWSSTVNCLEAIRKLRKNTKYYNAGSSECFGDTNGQRADESTPFKPKSPYGLVKASAYSVTSYYREVFEIRSCTGILFNHESPLRAEQFVTQKIVSAAIEIYRHERDTLTLGNITIIRDWGWAPDYVEGMHRILNHETPTDFVLASGKSYRLDEFVSQVFEYLGLDWTKHVEISKALYRPAEITQSLSNPGKAKHLLGWETDRTLNYIIQEMVEAKLKKL